MTPQTASGPAPRALRDSKPPQPTVAGKYQLGQCIGKGQFGAVFKAFDTEEGVLVAIKRIPIEDDNEAGIADLMEEVALLQSLSHPHIVHYEGFVVEDSCLNIILEYVETGSLLHVIRNYGVLKEKLAASYVMRALEGLVYLHDKGVVHCDIKAANILTNKDGCVKLSDFGVSRRLGAGAAGAAAAQAGAGAGAAVAPAAAATNVVGTPNWMAPEIIELSGPTLASDIWSLGCVVIELLTGKPPWSEWNGMTVLYKIVMEPRPPLPPSIS
ncbi:hypothetical protein CXG81DRAFT_13416, partial [Caulochytrium protostelioides]